jgi:hypothetical protein
MTMITPEQIQKGSIVQFKMHWSEEPTPMNTAVVLRIAKDRSWADVKTPYGSKRVPNPDENLKLVTKPLVVHVG